jgi:hypothetical protein
MGILPYFNAIIPNISQKVQQRLRTF